MADEASSSVPLLELSGWESIGESDISATNEAAVTNGALDEPTCSKYGTHETCVRGETNEMGREDSPGATPKPGEEPQQTKSTSEEIQEEADKIQRRRRGGRNEEGTGDASRKTEDVSTRTRAETNKMGEAWDVGEYIKKYEDKCVRALHDDLRRWVGLQSLIEPSAAYELAKSMFAVGRQSKDVDDRADPISVTKKERPPQSPAYSPSLPLRGVRASPTEGWRNNVDGSTEKEDKQVAIEDEATERTNHDTGAEKKQQQCYQCQKVGHPTWECTQLGPRRTKTCFKCGNTGHYANRCPPQPRLKPQPAPQRQVTTTCPMCGKVGHVATECREHLLCRKCGKKGHNSGWCRYRYGWYKLCQACGTGNQPAAQDVIYKQPWLGNSEEVRDKGLGWTQE